MSPAPRAGGSQGERGAATAELAMVLPLLLAVTGALVWMLTLVLAQMRVTDAAREAARAAARGDDPAAAEALAVQVAPVGSTVQVLTDGDRVRVVVTSDVRGPGGLLAHLPGAEVSSSAVAVHEPVGVATP
ncbi:TadE family type IV pilus minor pilin [Nocardioides acrostichi]|uniref:Pilus assembly protein n=1 Tax=Nocardioides acrostichi TaxID=2784339 RepID=A0A930YE86_9ACTN|nr:TadE family type IV pilus minor pilin [Nocardioides acrostichi]MBF4163254.1 pilus assembly protein [Nocardioides acrostichi]